MVAQMSPPVRCGDADAIVEHEFGQLCSVYSYVIKRIDSDFFEDEIVTVETESETADK